MCEDVLEFVVGVEGEFGVLFDVLDHLVDSDSLFGFHFGLFLQERFSLWAPCCFSFLLWLERKRTAGLLGRLVSLLGWIIFREVRAAPQVWGKALLNSSRWSESVS